MELDRAALVAVDGVVEVEPEVIPARPNMVPLAWTALGRCPAPGFQARP